MSTNCLWIALFTTAVLVQGQPQYEVQVRGPIDFEYRPGQENRLADGRCCSLEQEMQHPTSDNNSAVCPLGRMVFTPPTMNTDIITFNATIAATTVIYPGSLQLLYSVMVTIGGLEVESNRASLNISIQNKTSPLTTQTLGAERIVLSTGGIRVVCKEGYFGPDCGCTPQDDTNCVEEEGITPEPTTNPSTIPESPTNFSTAVVSDANTVEATPVTAHQSTALFPTETSMTGSIVSTISIMTTNIDDETTDLIQPTSTIGNNANPTSSIDGNGPTSMIQGSSSNAIITPTSVMGSSSNTILPSATTTKVTTTEPQSVLPIAVGGAVGGLVVLAIVILISVLLVYKSRRTNKIKADEANTTMISLEGLPNSNNNTEGSDSAEVYASVNKESKQEEAPPVAPYKGEIYSEVEKTGLFASNTVTPGEEEEPRYNTTQFASRAVHSSNEQLSEEPHYDTTFTKTTPSEEEPHYDTTARKVPNNTAAAQISEADYSVLNGGSSAQNIGSEYSTLGATTHYQNQAELQATQDERQYSELDTTKKPNDQVDNTGYSLLENEEPKYTEVESETKQPQLVYADLDIHSEKTAKKNEDNPETAEVHYSHIKT